MAQVNLDNSRLVRQVAAQRRSIALLRNECANRSPAMPAEGVRELGGARAPSAAQAMAELRKVGTRVEVAPGGPMSPISD